jgi:hypothetical protein
MMIDANHDDDLGPALERSASALREPVPVRAEWRAELLARIEGEAAERRAWRVRPSVAIAAGLLLLVAGGAIGRVSQRTAVSTSVVGAVVPASVRFVYVAPAAATVSVVGDFNQWNPTAMPLRRLGDGTWIVDVPLGPGRYAYAFVVDGKIEVDPVAPRAEGEFGENSVLMVRGS